MNFQETHRKAVQGDAHEQFALGAMYRLGICVPEDYKEALKWYQKAAELGEMYRLGICVPQDFNEALKWYKKAAEQQNAFAQCDLELMYANEKGTRQDNAEALKWEREKNAHNEDAEEEGAKETAQGLRYPGVACNYALIRFLPYPDSEEFVNIGIVLSCPKTGYFNARLEQQQFSRISTLFPEIKREVIQNVIDFFAKEMERFCVKISSHSDAQEQLPRKQQLSRHFFSEVVRPRESVVRCSEPRTGMAEKPEALLDALFERYVERLHAQEELRRNEAAEDEGEEERRSRIAAEQCKIQRAAEQGDAAAQCRLGDIYSIGYGVPYDVEKAVYWYRKAAEQGNADAQCDLGFMYRRGIGVPQDSKEAVKWFQKAAEQSHAEAENALGDAYYYSEGVPRDYKEAAQWYRKAAEQGDAAAQCRLGDIYSSGYGVPYDVEKAVYWYRKAAEQGSAGAQFRLGCIYEGGQGVPKDLSAAAEWFRKAADQGHIEAGAGLREVMQEMDRELNSRNEDAVDEGEEEIQSYRTKL
jgi:TPR repeat protein